MSYGRFLRWFQIWMIEKLDFQELRKKFYIKKWRFERVFNIKIYKIFNVSIFNVSQNLKRLRVIKTH